MTATFEQALEFAAKAHQGQLRKGTDIPYITHPVAVAWILHDAGCDEDVVVAGLLHDVTEDAKVPLDTLRKAFGERVARIVAVCSEPDKSLPWITRKEHSIRQLTECDDDARAVAAADKLHNVQCMLTDRKIVGDALWSRFKQGMHHQAWYYGSVAHAILTTAPSDPTRRLVSMLLPALVELFDPDFSTRWQIHPDRRQFLKVSRSEAERKHEQAGPSEHWYLAVDPESLAVKIVGQSANGRFTGLSGHEDLFPLAMAFVHADGFLPGGDWTAVETSGNREHDGLHRSYFINWID
jgi:hypothetical protein